ncbi:MAG: DUF302 domain-containing protein [Rhodospirillales bacterium]|nr:DUF302 domain-containing protein [Rhodospirillales bacterium]
MRARLAMMAMIGVIGAAPAMAETPAPYPGTETVATGKPFKNYIEDLKVSIGANGMGIVANACADCGARKIGVTIPGNQVIMVFKPPYAVRMLKASVAAGIEAPIRLYVTEEADGAATLTYRRPSAVFAPYEVADLDVMARELDAIFAKIVTDSLK